MLITHGKCVTWLQTTAPASTKRRRASHSSVAKDERRQRRWWRRKYKNGGVRDRQARCAVSAGQRVAGHRAAHDGRRSFDGGQLRAVDVAAAADARRRHHDKHLLHIQETAFSNCVTSLARRSFENDKLFQEPQCDGWCQKPETWRFVETTYMIDINLLQIKAYFIKTLLLYLNDMRWYFYVIRCIFLYDNLPTRHINWCPL